MNRLNTRIERLEAETPAPRVAGASLICDPAAGDTEASVIEAHEAVHGKIHPDAMIVIHAIVDPKPWPEACP